MKHILQLVNYYKNTISLTQATFVPLTFRSLPETFIRRSLVNSGSCHDSDATWQVIGRTCGSACSCPRPGSRTVVPHFEYILPLWSIKYFCPILCPKQWRPATRTVRPISCHVASLSWQVPEEELIKLLQFFWWRSLIETKTSKVKMLVVLS